MPAADISDVITKYERLLVAWNTQNAADFAALFMSDGHVVGFDGSPMNGRDEIATTLSSIFAHHQTASYVAKVRGVRLLRRGVALLRAVVGMVPLGQAQLNPAANAIQSVLFIEEDAGWQIALFQNTPAAFHGRPQMVEQLTAELTEVFRSGAVVQSA
jgi:uncharacterized protein (TIGR02246 family)